MVSPVIDLSHHNPTPNWAALKAGGVVGAIMKATEGQTYLDSTFHQRRADARAAGLIVCAYHFLKGGNPAGQMDWFVNKVGPVDGERMVIDHEADASLDDLCAAVERLQMAGRNIQVTIYSGHTIKDQLGNNGNRGELASTSLWIAQYTSAASPSWPKSQWKNWSLWQWTDKETFPGLSQPTDGNRWNGSPDALIRWMSPATSDPEPVPEPPQPEAQTVSLTIPQGLRLIVNGQEVEIPNA